jgi:hypothetical protein
MDFLLHNMVADWCHFIFSPNDPSPSEKSRINKWKCVERKHAILRERVASLYKLKSRQQY